MKTSSTSWQLIRLYNDSLKLLHGQGAVKDESRSFKLNEEAATAGYGDAVLAMGWFYLNGVGVQRSVAEAKKWYRKSARQGEPKAMFSLGQIAYEDRDFSGALTWFNRAISAGHARSLYWLGKLYWRGHGVVQDKKQANRLFHQAASKKLKEAQKVLRFLGR